MSVGGIGGYGIATATMHYKDLGILIPIENIRC